MMDTLPDDNLHDTEPVQAPVVYVVLWGVDSYDYSKSPTAVFTSKEKLLETVNAQPNMKAWIDDNGDVQIEGVYWHGVYEITLDKWE